MQRLGKSHYRSAEAHREPFQQLLKLLGGYPLAMEVVLNNLHTQTPAQVLDALNRADVKLDEDADTGDKTKSILRCIDYSHGNLSPLAQDLLLCLAPFTGVVNANWLPQYLGQLQKAWVAQPQKSDFSEKSDFSIPDAGQWQGVLQEAAHWGLVAEHEVGGGYLRLQPVLPYFLKTRLHDPAQATRQQVIETAFREHYQGIGEALAELITSKQPQERQTGQALIGLEYENLLTAVNLALTAQSNFFHAYEAILRFLWVLQQNQQAIILSEHVLSFRNKYPSAELQSEIGEDFALVLDRLAQSSLEVKAYAKAEQAYHLKLKYHAELIHLSEESKAIKRAGTINMLGIVAEMQRKWDVATEYFQQASQIFEEFNHPYQGNALHQLGIVAQEQRQWDAAADYFRQALQIFIAFNDRYEQAKEYHHLGVVAQEQRQWDAAADYFRQALQIFIEFNDRYSQGSTLNQLGQLAWEQEQREPSVDYYLQAITIAVEFKDEYRIKTRTENLARVWQASGQGAGIPARLAALLDLTPAQAEERLRAALAG